MSNPISILLIIGSAVVGPIQAQPTDIKPVEQCVEKFWKTHPYGMSSSGPTSVTSFCYELATLESLPELCERAMREIGVPQRYLAYHADGSMGGVIPGGPPGKGYERDVVVRCIPTPTGYVK